MAGKNEALAEIDTFESSARTGVWTNITKTKVVSGLRERVNDPSKIDQAGSMLCGPAAFAFDLATDDPVTYTKAVIDLYTGGTAVVGTLPLRPSKDLIFNHFSGGIDPTDWIFLASLRDSTNWLFDQESVDDLLGAATIPSSMVRWLRNVGYTNLKEESNVWFTKDGANLRKANQFFGKQFKVLLFINSAMLHTNRQTDLSLAPDHWVMLRSAISISGPPLESLQSVSFRVYSWGAEQNVPENAKGTLRLSDLLSNYYGFIAFKH